MSALDIIRGDVQFEIRVDSNGNKFEYENSGYSEESDRNFILLFMTYKALSLPMGKYLDILAGSMAQSLKSGVAKSVIVGMMDRASNVLNRQDLKGGAKNYSHIKRQILSPLKEDSEYKNAGWYMADGMVAELAEKTREPKIRVGGGKDRDGGAEDEEHMEGTPFPRLFAIYNSDTYKDHNRSPQELTKLYTTWELLEHDPMKGVEVPSPVVENSGVAGVDEVEIAVEDDGTDAPDELSEGGGIEMFFNECAEKLMGDS